MDLMKRLLMPCLLIIAVGTLPAGLADAQQFDSFAPPEPSQDGMLVVQAGETVELASSLRASNILIEGHVIQVADGPLHIYAETIHITETGSIQAKDGARGATTGSAEHAPPGLPGSDIWMSAQRIVIEPGARIAAGSGGAGGSVIAPGNATGGHGGNGGSIIIAAEELQLDAHLWPGRGGDGGHALSASAKNGTPARASGGDGGSSGVIWVNGERLGTDAAAPAAAETTATPPKSKLIESVRPSIKDWPEFDEDAIENFLIDCVPTGHPGKPNSLGAGGQGGDGCASSTGRPGNHGADGNDGFWGCTDGGHGGHGGSSTAPAATGGRGGDGLTNGGGGGSATSIGHGNSGGNGGNGGKATMNSDCAGGNGGNGGNGIGGPANGGNGGNGLCGSGGDGGTANSLGNPGAGGSGGSGNPSGLAGLPGSGSSGSAVPGGGGTGLNLGCREIDLEPATATD